MTLRATAASRGSSRVSFFSRASGTGLALPRAPAGGSQGSTCSTLPSAASVTRHCSVDSAVAPAPPLVSPKAVMAASASRQLSRGLPKKSSGATGARGDGAAASSSRSAACRARSASSH